MSLALLFHYLMLNVFRILIHPSSRACDLFVELFHGLYCCVRIEVFALAYLFSGECLVVMCVVVLESVSDKLPEDGAFVSKDAGDGTQNKVGFCDVLLYFS